MADEVNKPAPTQDELLKNMKSEFDRKFSNVNEQLEKQNQMLAEQLNAITQKLTPKAPAEDIENLKYSDPDKYVAHKEREIEERILGKVEAVRKQDTQVQQTLVQLSKDFPELQDIHSELSQKAIEKYNKLDDGIKNSPIAHKTAILEAAAELGMVPKAKRKAEAVDEFTFEGSGRNPPYKSNNKKTVDPNTLVWAQLLGRDVNDPKVVEGLEKAAKRNKWSKYE